MQDYAATLRIDSLEDAKKLTIKPDYVIENNSWRTEDDKQIWPDEQSFRRPEQ